MKLLPRPDDRREHRRLKVQLAGRYMLSDRREYPCTILDLSVGGLALTGPRTGNVGESVVIYADELGRMLGQIVRLFDGGFAVELNIAGIAGRRFNQRLAELEAPRLFGNRLRFWR